MALSVLGTVHMTAACVSLAAGATQVIRSPRDQFHRRMGYVYVATMTANNLTALWIYKFTGSFNVFHALAIYSMVSVILAIRPMLVKPRPFQWRRMHYMWMAWSYVGLWAAAVTEFLARIVVLEGWLAAAVGSGAVFLLGAPLVMRFAPARRPVAA